MANLTTSPISCPICLEGFGANNGSVYPNVLITDKPKIRYIADENVLEIKVLRVCSTVNHIFCDRCINEWSDENKNCPICRRAYEKFYSMENFSEVFVDTTGKTWLVFRKSIACCSPDEIEIIYTDLLENDLKAAVNFNENPEVFKEIMSIPDEKKKSEILHRIAGIYLREHDPQQASRLLMQSERVAMAIPDEDSKSYALFKIAKAYISEKDLSKAEQIAMAIPDEYFKFQTLCEIAEAYISEKDLSKAEQIAMAIPYERSQSIALCMIAKAYVLEKDSQQSSRLLKLSEEIAMVIPDGPEKSEALGEIAELCLSEKNFAEQIVMFISNSNFRSHLLNKISPAYKNSSCSLL